MLAVLILVAGRSAALALALTLLDWGVGDVVEECSSCGVIALLLKVVEDVGAVHNPLAVVSQLQ